MINNEQASVSESPWKKQKPVVSLARTKSLKRKSEIFATLSQNSLDNSATASTGAQQFQKPDPIDDLPEPASKSRKTFLSKFSVRSALNDSNSAFNSLNEKNDLFSFFNGNEPPPAFAVNTEEKPSSVNKQKINETLASISNSMVSSFYTDNDSLKVKPKEEEVKTYNFEHDSLIPIDWSLKTRLRFISTRTFSCNNGIKSSHESEAISNYAKFNSFYSSLDTSRTNSDHLNKDLFKTLFCEATNYWTFPYLPWLNLYPRNSGLSNLSSMQEPLNAEIQKALSKSWNQSFKSLYNSLKSNECPYFYVLTHSYIVLFRAQNIGVGQADMQAILTPSTKGLRQALKDINFEMPLMPANARKSVDNNENLNESNEQQNNSLSDQSNNNNKNENLNNSNQDEVNDKNSSLTTATNSNSNENVNTKKENDDDDEDENDDDTDEPDEWLEQIGLNSAVNFKPTILQRNSKNAQRESILSFDNRPRSTLLFTQGSDVQALFNFLLNSKSCVCSSGPLTGIPPTLLSPTPFIGGNLQKIKVEQNIIKSLDTDGQSKLVKYALDFIGPIMPYHIHRLCNLFRETQVSDFEMIANTYDQTSSLNCAKKKTNKSEGEEDQHQQDSGLGYSGMCLFLDESERKSLENYFGIFGESQAIKNMSFKDDKIRCNY